jgi:hypothetical protein
MNDVFLHTPDPAFVPARPIICENDYRLLRLSALLTEECPTAASSAIVCNGAASATAANAGDGSIPKAARPAMTGTSPAASIHASTCSCVTRQHRSSASPALEASPARRRVHTGPIAIRRDGRNAECQQHDPHDLVHGVLDGLWTWHRAFGSGIQCVDGIEGRIGQGHHRGRGTRGQPLAVRWIMVRMVTATCGNTKDRVIAPDYPAMFGPKS